MSNLRRRADVEASVQMQLLDRPGVAIRRVHAVINPTSGGVAPGAADELGALFAEFGLDHRVSELTPGQFNRTMRAAIDSGPDLVVVLGGDGTAGRVAQMCGPDGPLVAPLPGGTMSKLGRAIYGANSWREALSSALAGGEARWISGGEVAGHAFYCSAVLGSPALWARAREAFRAGKLRSAWRRAVIPFRHAQPTPLRYRFDGAEIGGGLIIGLICPTVSRALGEDARALEAVVLDLRGTKAGVRLALNNLLGDWRDDPGVTVRRCVGAKVWARQAIPAMLDGEFLRLGRQVEARFRPRAFRALAPGAAGEAAA
jgi:diacylglycerol kinase family enzyme